MLTGSGSGLLSRYELGQRQLVYMRRLVTAVVFALLVLGIASPRVLGQTSLVPDEDREIVGVVARNGRVVLTNMGGPRIVAEPSGSPASGPAVSAYRQLIDSISRRHGVDPQLTEAVIEVESAFNPNAVSAMGALGLIQLIPATGSRFGVSNFFDPADNIRGGVEFLSFLIDKFQGNTDLVLAAYNSGENRVERLGRVPAIPETQDYIRKVRRAWERLRGSSPLDTLLRAPTETEDRGMASAIYRTVGESGVLKFSNFGVGR